MDLPTCHCSKIASRLSKNKEKPCRLINVGSVSTHSGFREESISWLATCMTEVWSWASTGTWAPTHAGGILAPRWIKSKSTRRPLPTGRWICLNLTAVIPTSPSRSRVWKSEGSHVLVLDTNCKHLLAVAGYPLMSKALNATGRPIGYSCSWPAYCGGLPPKVCLLLTKGFLRIQTFLYFYIHWCFQVNYTQLGEICNLWRNYDDIQDSWDSVLTIVDWFFDNQDVLQPAAGPGRWNDPDMVSISPQTTKLNK